jgi:hypothetical protein
MSPRHIKAAQALASGKPEYEAAREGGWSHDAALAWQGCLTRFLDKIGLGRGMPALNESAQPIVPRRGRPPKETPSAVPPPEPTPNPPFFPLDDQSNLPPAITAADLLAGQQAQAKRDVQEAQALARTRAQTFTPSGTGPAPTRTPTPPKTD